MTVKIVCVETLKADRRTGNITQKIAYISPTGEMREVTKEIVNGEMNVLEFTRPLGEMITTPAGLDTVVQKTVIDLELGREEVPLLYGPIFRPVEDPNMSQNVDVNGFIGCQVVFLEHLEGEDVKFGTRKVGSKDTVPIVTYTAGLEWTEDMVEYDKTWEMTEANRSFGEAHNALLNHIHLNPILSFVYAAKNKTAADATGQTAIEKLRNTIEAGLEHAAQDKQTDTKAPRKPNILLAHSSKRMRIERCLKEFQANGTVYPELSQIDTLIFYDGWSGEVGKKTITYAGVDTGKAYLIQGKKYFRELIKHGLRVDATGADLKRLIENGIVGRVRRGVIASPANAVEELTLP
jgi:hypothetical protein